MKTDHMTFSGLHRYARICETVLNSSAMLSGNDRIELMHTLIDSKDDLSVAAIEMKCSELADANLEQNMVNAQILRSSR